MAGCIRRCSSRNRRDPRRGLRERHRRRRKPGLDAGRREDRRQLRGIDTQRRACAPRRGRHAGLIATRLIHDRSSRAPMIGRRSGRPAVARVQNSISLDLAASRDLDSRLRPRGSRPARRHNHRAPSARNRSSSSITARLTARRPYLRRQQQSQLVLPVPGGPWMREMVVSRVAAAPAPARASATAASEIQSRWSAGPRAAHRRAEILPAAPRRAPWITVVVLRRRPPAVRHGAPARGGRERAPRVVGADQRDDGLQVLDAERAPPPHLVKRHRASSSKSALPWLTVEQQRAALSPQRKRTNASWRYAPGAGSPRRLSIDEQHVVLGPPARAQAPIDDFERSAAIACRNTSA